MATTITTNDQNDRDNAGLTQQVEDLQAEIVRLKNQHATDGLSAGIMESRIRQLEAMLDMVPVGVVLANETGEIIHGNSHVELMLRHPVLHSPDIDAYGDWISYHADGRRVETHEYPLARILTENLEEAELQCHYQRGDGSRIWLRITGRPIRDKSGQRIGATVALIDIDREIMANETQRVLIGELNHRVKNAFAVVKAIVSQSLRKSKVSSDVRARIEARLDAYGTAHAKLVGSTWIDTSLDGVASDIVTAFADGRVSLNGGKIHLAPRKALSLSMAFYELSTNALKYGSLSAPDGRVDLSWQKQPDGKVRIIWRESGGPTPKEPEEKGFGSFIIDRAISAETSGEVVVDYAPTGLVWTLTMPITDEPSAR